MTAPCPRYGFEVLVRLAPGVDPQAAAAVWDAFIAGPVDGRGLACPGRPSGPRWARVVYGEAGQATDADRQAVMAWAAGQPDIAGCEVGPLVDLAAGL